MSISRIEYKECVDYRLILPYLKFYSIRLQKELIREVEMGPFKHTLDDGLDIRKVCCAVLLRVADK